MLRRYILFLFLLTAAVFSAQTLSTRLSKERLTVGEPAEFEVRITGLGGQHVQAANKNELLPFHFEETSDTVQESADGYTRLIKFTVWQEGKFNIPALEFRVGNLVAKSVPYTVEVINPANPGDELNDVVGNKQANLGFADYWELYKWYVYVALLLIAIVFMIIVLKKYAFGPKDQPKEITNKTLRQLEALVKKNYLKNGEIRQYYVELVDIARSFVTEQYHLPADVLLTEDLVEAMKQNNIISPENEAAIEDLLKTGDQVKFAKIFPEEELARQQLEALRAVAKRSRQDVETEKLREGV